MFNDAKVQIIFFLQIFVNFFLFLQILSWIFFAD